MASMACWFTCAREVGGLPSLKGTESVAVRAITLAVSGRGAPGREDRARAGAWSMTCGREAAGSCPAGPFSLSLEFAATEQGIPDMPEVVVFWSPCVTGSSRPDEEETAD